MLRELEPCTILVVHPRAPMLLAQRGSNLTPALPTVLVPKYSRLAEEVTEAVARKWGLNVIALFRPETAGTREQALVLEPLDAPRCGVADLEWWPFTEFEQEGLAPGALQQLERFECGGNGHFSRRGWIHDLDRWIAGCIKQLGLRLTHRIKQYNCGPNFTLIRFETDGAAVWFKATGDPNRNEFAITRELARRVPEFAPDVIALHDEWNGWLMREAEGEPIDVCTREGGWIQAARALGSVLSRFPSNIEFLRTIGCRDRSFEWAESKIDSFFEQAESWMQRQPAGTAAQPLRPAQLRELKERMGNALAELRALGIGETIAHGDINAGNLFVSPARCVILDWAEAWISQPFVTLEYFSELLKRAQPDRIDWLDAARAAYTQPWREAFGDTLVDRALALSPAAAALIYALSCANAPAGPNSQQLRREAFLRSLIRRMDRETRAHKEAAA